MTIVEYHFGGEEKTENQNRRKRTMEIKICRKCGEVIDQSSLVSLCETCKDKKQKHEEIKRMAFELHIKNSMFKEDAWKMAEKFYDYAKEKEREEANDEM